MPAPHDNATLPIARDLLERVSVALAETDAHDVAAEVKTLLADEAVGAAEETLNEIADMLPETRSPEPLERRHILAAVKALVALPGAAEAVRRATAGLSISSEYRFSLKATAQAQSPGGLIITGALDDAPAAPTDAAEARGLAAPMPDFETDPNGYELETLARHGR